MANLKDLFEIDTILENFHKIRTPEQLLGAIQSAQDVFDKNIAYIRKVPNDLARWETTLKNIGILSENTNVVSEARDTIFRTVHNATKGTILEGKLGLESLISEGNAEKQTLAQSIGDVKVDYVFYLKPKYKTTTTSQPIISSKNLDRLNEHAENENDVYIMSVGLKGQDAERRFQQINSIRTEKQIIRIVANRVLDQCLITDISTTEDNKSGIILDITLQNVYIAQLKRTANRYVPKTVSPTGENTPTKEVTSANPTPSVEPPKPVEPQQIPKLSAKELYKENITSGIKTPMRYKKRTNFGIRR